MMEYKNATSGLEELHVFFSIGWFDLGSWAWAHHIVEWATKGVFLVRCGNILLRLSCWNGGHSVVDFENAPYRLLGSDVNMSWCNNSTRMFTIHSESQLFPLFFSTLSYKTLLLLVEVYA